MDSCPAGSCPEENCPVGSCQMGSCPVQSCAVRSCPVGSCQVGNCPMGSCPVENCPVGSCRVESCPVRSCPVGSCPVGSWRSPVGCRPEGFLFDKNHDCGFLFNAPCNHLKGHPIKNLNANILLSCVKALIFQSHSS